MAAATPFSELPHPFDKPFQPAPEFNYARLFRSTNQQEADLQGRGGLMQRPNLAPLIFHDVSCLS